MAGFISIQLVTLGSARTLELKQAERYGTDPAYQASARTVPVLFPLLPIHSLRNLRIHLRLLIWSGLLSRGRGEAPPGWVPRGASLLPWLGWSWLVRVSWSTACQSDIRGLVTAGRCFGGSCHRWSRGERRSLWSGS